ncbi:MAG: BMP family protein [Candidatus Omnitrophica bacterium]|nr:BMP family protein [Candidatus Omnitrophota bacterium]MCB9770045.1 BMP family protein [Candidatus Omnitrophota bacterium]
MTNNMRPLVLALFTSLLCTSPIAAKEFQVGLLTPGPISDNGWNAGAYEGLMKIKKELGAKVSHVQVRSPAEHEEHFRSYGEDGFDLVFGHGFEFQDAARRVGRDFPDTYYVTTSGNTVTKNVGAIVFELEQATYLLGRLAAEMSKTGTIGMIGGMEIPSVESTFIAFEAGAKSVKPDCTVLRTYIGSWEDNALAREATLAQINRGADFIFHNADAAGLGVFQAVEESKDKGVYAFGSNKNQNGEAPEVILASAVIDIPSALLSVAKKVQAGEYEAGVTRFDLGSGIISLEINPKLKDRIPDEVLKDLDSVQAEIISGKTEVPRGDF